MTRIFGPTRIQYEGYKITYKIILNSKLNELHDRYAETSRFLNEVLKKEHVQENTRNEPKEQATDTRYVKRTETKYKRRIYY